MNTANRHFAGPGNRRSSAIRLMKWIVLIVLVVLLLLALFLPDRHLAGLAARESGTQLLPVRLPSASSTPSEKRMQTRSPSNSNGTAIRASSW